MKKHSFILLLFITTATFVSAQGPKFSLATDLSVLRSFKKEQRFWAIGQTVVGHFHFTKKDGGYIWVGYYNNGRFSNNLTATAKSPVTIPQQLPYSNNAKMSFRHISIGWKRYLKGTYDIERGWNLYGFGGFGLMIGRIENSHSVIIDSANYALPVLNGKANFKRLTFDLGLGYEISVGGDVYFYMEGRALIPTTEYPSNYILINDNAPFTASINFGFRIFFD